MNGSCVITWVSAKGITFNSGVMAWHLFPLFKSTELSLRPPKQLFIAVTIPRGISYEVVTKYRLPGWDAPDPSSSREFGSRWIGEARYAILLVPSHVARLERDVVINPAHPDAASIETSLPEPVWWDERLLK